jgi:hypothetical protein
MFNLDPSTIRKYKRSYKGMTKKKASLKRSLKRNELDIRAREQKEYRIELINVIQGYMRVVLREGNKTYNLK